MRTCFLFLLSLLLSAPVLASVEGDVSLFSNFIWRGVTFSNNRPALQAQIDAENQQGFYLGSFVSNAEFSDEAKGSRAQVTQEIDFTVGKRWRGDDWSLQFYYAQFLFPNAEAFNADEWNLLLKWRRFTIELSYMDDFFGYHTTYRYARLGYEWVYWDTFEGALLVGYNQYSRERGAPISRIISQDEQYHSMNGGYKNYFDVFWVSRKTFENKMAAEIALNWTNRREYDFDGTEVTLEKTRDFALIVGLLIPFTL
jgi:uncharacterized protein (TIGR02001 family)